MDTLAPSSNVGDVLSAIRSLGTEQRVSLALRRSDELRIAAAADPRAAAVARCLADLSRTGDDVVALAAIHAIGAVDDPLADRVLDELVREGSEPFAAHAAWSLAARRPQLAAVAPLLALCTAGGFPSMLAERTLIEWTRTDAAVLGEVAHAASVAGDGHTRARLVALYGTLSEVIDPQSSRPRTPFATSPHGLVIIQPCVHARIDSAGSTLGTGDSGGVASLLRSLGPALASQPGISEVISVMRANGSELLDEYLAPGHRVRRLRVGPDGPLPSKEAWQYRVDVERQLLALGESLSDRTVVWHLRMADVGTLAAAAVARRLGQRVVFTAAPDPHIVIDALQDAGRLQRAGFALEDAAHHYWFRARLVERVARQADHLVLLPRPTIREELRELVGLDDGADVPTMTSVPEGVDTTAADHALAMLAAHGPDPVVRQVLDRLGPERRHLPWLLTVGRLHPAKGAHRLVEAVASDATLRDSVNIVIVGGDLQHPTADEQSTIERIRRAGRNVPAGLVTLTGHLTPRDVAALLAYTAASDGVYVCASDKEEFGLAIVEAMAAGVVVVAPRRGGPQTYIDHGDTGVLCDTSVVPDLHDAIVRARTLVGDAARQKRARSMVRANLSVEVMAASLAGIYRDVAAVAAVP